MKGMHGIIFSYERKSDLRELVENRIQGSVPFAGEFRVIDFALSNMVNAGITDVGVIMHGKCQSLMNHIGNGKSWDLSRNYGGLTMLPAFAFSERGASSAYIGHMEALAGILSYLKRIRQDYVVLSNSDQVINIDLKDVLADHEATGADITVVCTKNQPEGKKTYFKLDANRKVYETLHEEKVPDGFCYLDIFIVKTEKLIEITEECMAHNRHSLVNDVYQAMSNCLKIYGYVFEGYQAQITTVEGYYKSNMELLDFEVGSQLFRIDRPIMSKVGDSAYTFIDPDTECVNSMICDGCNIQGTVRNSVLSRNVIVEKGAVVEDCILFKNTVVRAGAKLKHVIADKAVEFTSGATLMGTDKYPVVIKKGGVV